MQTELTYHSEVQYSIDHDIHKTENRTGERISKEHKTLHYNINLTTNVNIFLFKTLQPINKNMNAMANDLINKTNVPFPVKVLQGPANTDATTLTYLKGAVRKFPDLLSRQQIHCF